MMKKIKLLLSVLFIIVSAHSQSVLIRTSGSSTVQDGRLVVPLNLVIPRFLDTSSANAQAGIDSCGAKILTYEGGLNKEWVRKCSPKRWVQNSTSEDLPDLSNYIQKQTQNPTATLTGGEIRELMSSGADLSYTLNWGAGRAAATPTAQATANLSTINVAGTSETFSNPSAGSTVSGTQAVTVVRNANTTFTNTVTTADGKTATASTTVYFPNDKYWFYSDAATPTSGEITAHSGGNIDLLATETRAKSNFSVVVSGTKYIHYMYPSRLGALTSIKAGNVESKDAFTRNTVSVTNSAGFTENYFDYVNNATFTNTIFTFDTVQ